MQRPDCKINLSLTDSYYCCSKFLISSNDATQTGHDLGDPNGRTAVPAPERNLSPSAICVLRALMHSAFLWACCNNDQRIGDIIQLVKHDVPVPGLPEFFWRHLDKDIELLGRAVGKGYEEAAMIVHLVLREILIKDPPGSEFIDSFSDIIISCRFYDYYVCSCSIYAFPAFKV